MNRPCILQINQTGAWRNVISFDASGLPDEALDHADKFLRLMCADRTTARVMVARPGAEGSGFVATQVMLMRWTRTEGWVNT